MNKIGRGPEGPDAPVQGECQDTAIVLVHWYTIDGVGNTELQ